MPFTVFYSCCYVLLICYQPNLSRCICLVEGAFICSIRVQRIKRKMSVWISAPKILSFVVVVVVDDDNAVVVVFQGNSSQKTHLWNEKILKKHKREINCDISMHLILIIQHYFCFIILM